jgi:hypothetical protein
MLLWALPLNSARWLRNATFGLNSTRARGHRAEHWEFDKMIRANIAKCVLCIGWDDENAPGLASGRTPRTGWTLQLSDHYATILCTRAEDATFVET